MTRRNVRTRIPALAAALLISVVILGCSDEDNPCTCAPTGTDLARCYYASGSPLR